MLMQEVGRLREGAYRLAGGGTGKKIDIDEMDTGEDPYEQLIVWNPEDQEILGGYRFYKCLDAERGDFDPIISVSLKNSLLNIFLTWLNWVVPLCNLFLLPVKEGKVYLLLTTSGMV